MLSISPSDGDVYAAAQVRMQESLRFCGDPYFEAAALAGTGTPLQRAFEKLDAVASRLPEEKRLAAMWDVVHATALAAERLDGSTEAHKRLFNRLATFVLRSYVPSALRCRRCSKHWNAALNDASPIAATSLFAKTVEIHNDVNALLGKPSMGVADARRAYSWAS
jgi:hypothetical protein